MQVSFLTAKQVTLAHVCTVLLFAFSERRICTWCCELYEHCGGDPAADTVCSSRTNTRKWPHHSFRSRLLLLLLDYRNSRHYLRCSSNYESALKLCFRSFSCCYSAIHGFRRHIVNLDNTFFRRLDLYYIFFKCCTASQILKCNVLYPTDFFYKT